jgi:hypothetical protein
MRMRTAPFTFLAVVLGICLYATPAAAQGVARTWVSSFGDDANPCAPTAPCRTFAGAISKTAAGGEINVLGPGGFGAVTITKSISIISTIQAGVFADGVNGITVNIGANDSVLLEGLDIEGYGTGHNGVTIIGGGKTMIRKCAIRNFTQSAVNLVGFAARVFVADSLLLRNNIGVNITTPGKENFAAVQGTIIDLSTATATQVTGSSTLQLSTTTLSGSPASITNSGGTVISYGNNIIRNAGSPTMTVALQ